MRSNEELLSNLALSLDEIFRIEDATVNNELIAQYYEARQMNDRATRVRKCGRQMFFNEYRAQGVLDLQKVYLCRDPFCINCQRYKVRGRLMDAVPAIEEAKKLYDMYLLTLTQKNVVAETYYGTVKRMAKAFRQFVNYLTGHTKIKGLDLSYLGYGGAIRAFETTFTETEFHPHLHVMLALSKDLFFRKNMYNDYSPQYKTTYDNGRRVRKKTMRKFCELEITIQKIWYLLMNNEEVTLKAINNLALGYSCTLDVADDKSTLEVFKYAIKSFGEDSKHLTPEQFNTILDGITGFRTIECYGIFRGIIDRDSLDQQVFMSVYDAVIAALELREKPQYDVYKRLFDVKKDLIEGNLIYINRRALFANAWDTLHQMTDLTDKILEDYNLKHRRRFSPEQFMEKVRQRGEMREIMFKDFKRKKKEKQKLYTDRSRARTRYVKQKMKENGKSISDPDYAYEFLRYKVEYNNLHPLPNKDIAPLPF